LLPSGILREGLLCVITAGVALDPEVLLQEIDGLAERGITVAGNLRISGRAHLVMEYHKKQDRLSEEALCKDKIGTTIRGIGPCYSDKVMRTTALRVTDLLQPERLYEKLERILDYKNRLFHTIYADNDPIDLEEIYKKCRLWADHLQPFITDTTALLHKACDQGKSILFEGAQGSLLDLDHGTFPYVTSSNSSAVGLPAGTGLPAKVVDRFLGVAKAYSTRVGAGPFPTEQDNQTGDYIRDQGHEYGTTTGRPRRCGWFDAVCVGYSIKIGGITEMILQHLDTLSGLKELKLCTAYRYKGKKLEFFPAEEDVLQEVQCEYETMNGFDDDITEISEFDQLPAAAKEYVLRLEELLHIPIRMVGVGPGREQTLSR